MMARHLPGEEPLAHGLRVAARQGLDMAQALQAVHIAHLRSLEARRESGCVCLVMLADERELARLVVLELGQRQPLRGVELGEKCGQRGILVDRDRGPGDPFDIGFLRDDLQTGDASVLAEGQHRTAFGKIIGA